MTKNKSHILITGGAGFIGTNLLNMYLERSDCPALTVVDLKAKPEDFNSYPSYIRGDFCDNWLLHDVFSYAEKHEVPITHVIHLAGQVGVPESYNNPYRDANINAMGMLKLLDACRRFKVKRFVFASSTAVIGDGINTQDTLEISEATHTHPISPYGISKLSAEHYLRCECETYQKMKGTSLRFANIYGPYSEHKNSVIMEFIKDAIVSGYLYVDGKGEQTRDFVYVEDLCLAIHKALFNNNKTPSMYNVFNIASGESHSISDIADIIAIFFKTMYNEDLKIRYRSLRIGEVGEVNIYPHLASLFLDWRATTSITDGVLKTIEYFKTLNIS
jgi:UDP-glucose 4-epimerase